MLNDGNSDLFGMLPTDSTSSRTDQLHPDMMWITQSPFQKAGQMPSPTSDFVQAMQTGRTLGQAPAQLSINSSVPHYPSQRYVDKNLAPEQTLKYEDLYSLAKARKTAEESGVLSPELGEYMLPMAMVEGRSGNHGIRREFSFYAKPQTVDRFKKMGLSVTEDPEENADLVVGFDSQGRGNYGKDKFVQAKDIQLGPKYANLMAAILSEKASLKGITTPEDAIKRYNGVGKATEYADGKQTPADVDVYLNKVLEAKRMLDHPKNKAFKDYFTNIYNGK